MKSKNKESVVEDQFFKLSEMENFLDAEDAKAMKDKKVDADDDDNEDSIDYFGSDMDEEDSEAPGLMYKDLFDPVDNVDEQEPPSQDQEESSPVPNNDLLESDDNDENSEDEEMGEMKSSHELRTQRLQKKSKKLKQML